MKPQTRCTVAINTHGCKLNQADSQQLARQFQEAGFVLIQSSAQADVVVLNSCTVTANADSKARSYLRRTRRANPNALVVATGCYAERARDDLLGMDEVSLVLDNRNKQHLVATVAANLNINLPVGSSDSSRNTNSRPLELLRTRAMVKIQEGCNQVCSYCIVPKVRGRERSVPAQEIIDEINTRSTTGRREVVLTGTQLGTYGFDLPGTNLTELIRKVLAETTVDRLRISSLQPQEITPELLNLWENPRLCPHFHIPLQTGCDTLLRAMRRRYSTTQFAETVQLIRSKILDAGVTTDIIIGFPGEGAREFAESYTFAESMNFSDMHVFPYSIRPGTTAAHLCNHVDDGIKKERTGEMLELATMKMRQFRLGSLQQVRPVLWNINRSGEPSEEWIGLTDNYLQVRTQQTDDLANTITKVRLTSLDGDCLTTEAI
ncbi:MAG: tRNA (N(6)-L-threonylcarbamoyladenosine(37)-C(2))-methylthiotransferase MtaB [Chloroflexota bacterium]|jgi:threonylcarbamoyladenosine tRNA methylthiotransferase MtaB|nr:MAG: tRNA (N(6)-L-threonylcarbamoyladenosine(37)-C(2))-methylthiotransferase MtaB [SAR202 cluster bacterium]MEE3014233.1 tRNA (N(6)-L-threonylcarbamoyladenosine(37)-C(2))-methylthiotransferase MtaB [Chloroflexota bacterium]GIS94409.1 MAG: tRNA (N(6)-L-threonylcarbamoyladenosine(37)-C(2))-methylthiotransferase MtaB [Dehalococcoidia bacterium]|tara:strand:- start:24 stop:1325 length:1302 start_codon:yes stop_codon:yes gene_type:complete